MINRSKSRNYYNPPVRPTWRPDLKYDSTHVLRQQPIPNQPSGLLARSGFNLVPPEGEKTTEPETSNNRLAAPLEFLAASVSSETPAESISFMQYDFHFVESNDALPLAVSPALIEETVPSLAAAGQQAQLFDMEERSSQETKNSRESKLEEEGRSGLSMFTMNSESECAGSEFETPTLWLWDPGVAKIAEEHSQAPIDEIAKNSDNSDMRFEFAPAELETPLILPVSVAEEKSAATTLLAFYGLRQQPFDVTPDPSYLYFSPSHREALTSISEGVENFRGFMALIAEPGMGKTTLLNKLMEELSASARVVFLFQTQCTSSELLAFFLNELEVDHTGMDVVAMHRALNQVLLEEMLRGRRFVLIVDEAQNLQDSVLETIRLLSDFETAHSKLIQIVLAGQPQLVDTLLRPNLVQLRQRIAVLTSLKALSVAETAEYVEHRLRAAGWNGLLLFTPEALETIAELSAGIPRTINNLCFNALLLAFTRRQEIIDSGIVKEVAGKLHLEALARRPQNVAAKTLQPATQIERSSAEELAQPIAAALAAVVRANPAESAAKPQQKPSIVLVGKLIEKISCQSWSKKHEFRIGVSFERDPINGISVAERHYFCNFYIGEEEAAALQVGKPIRIRIEQD